MTKLAINGGKKIRTELFPAYNSIGQEEKLAAQRVLDSGILSRFQGSWNQDFFYGGTEVRALENEWAASVGAKYAIAVNSATSALFCAVGAIGIEPGEEIIVSPYTMSASAIAPLIYNAIPVFADIEEDCFCLSAESIEQKITPKTKAIIVVDIFGQAYNVEKINAIAKKHNLFIIEDNAQGPFAKYQNKFAGTLGDIGLYSLNYHKHIHSGEGGILVTNNDKLAEKLQLIRNHGEVVIEGKTQGKFTKEQLVNNVGYNYRMTEIEAAIAREQLKKLSNLVTSRQEKVVYLEKQLSQIPFLTMPKVRENATHSYYLHAMKFNAKMAGINREKFVEAVKAELMPTTLREKEGVKIGCGYVKPLYLNPIFQNKICYGSQGYPWSAFENGIAIDYNKGICPTVEKMHYEEVITHELMHSYMTKQDLDDVVSAFTKVAENISELK